MVSYDKEGGVDCAKREEKSRSSYSNKENGKCPFGKKEDRRKAYSYLENS